MLMATDIAQMLTRRFENPHFLYLQGKMTTDIALKMDTVRITEALELGTHLNDAVTPKQNSRTLYTDGPKSYAPKGFVSIGAPKVSEWFIQWFDQYCCYLCRAVTKVISVSPDK
jgi:hypothetical protein